MTDLSALLERLSERETDLVIRFPDTARQLAAGIFLPSREKIDEIRRFCASGRKAKRKRPYKGSKAAKRASRKAKS